MASNSFGTLFRITTWGESHGKAIGVVVDGCPAGVALDEEEITAALALRRPGNSPFTSPRKEADNVEILSGLFSGLTTGTPISLIIYNTDVESKSYEVTKSLYRPGHAEYTYAHKYGVYDFRGGGRSSARETACRVAAGAVAKKDLAQEGIAVSAYLNGMGEITMSPLSGPTASLREATYRSPVYNPDPETTEAMVALLRAVQQEGDSIGGDVTFSIEGVPAGLGDPVYEKIEANLAKAMLSLPAAKAFSIGEEGACSRRGSEYNDPFIPHEGHSRPATNRAGGLLGGITTGMPIWGRATFKPPSSIKKNQQTTTVEGVPTTFAIPAEGRHDPCVAIRAVPVVEAMAALVLVDALLLQRCQRW